MMNILISACLLGVNCRYNAVEKKNEKALDLLRNAQSLGIHLIPICPEQMGGLPTPRYPSERLGDRVINTQGEDVTAQYKEGAKQAIHLAEIYGCKHAVLKERSPSCGSLEVYDGSFSKTLVKRDGVTSELLKEHGISVYGESQLYQLLEDLSFYHNQ